MRELKLNKILLLDYNMDFFWDSSFFFRDYTWPNWSGFITQYSAGNYPEKSNVAFLPIIDLSRSDPSCIFTTLEFVIDQAKSLNVETPVITFDQPLWVKATEITTAKSMSIVIILGGFHLMMSYMGSVGIMMKGSGLEQALMTCYGSNTIEDMITGKAVSRALRGHLLASSSPQIKLLTYFFPGTHNCVDNGEVGDVDLHSEEEEFENKDEVEDEEADENTILVDEVIQFEEEDLIKLEEVFEDMQKSPTEAPHLIAESTEMQLLTSRYDEHKNKLKKKSQTVKFWLQCLDHINILKIFIRAERTGNWNLHLVVVSKMINSFVATAHVHYAKRARLYPKHVRVGNQLPIGSHEFCYTWISHSKM